MSTATAVKERALRLTDDEVRAVLATTTATLYLPIKLNQFQRSKTPGYDWTFRCERGLWQDYREADLVAKRCPHGKPGDRLWVKEAAKLAGTSGFGGKTTKVSLEYGVRDQHGSLAKTFAREKPGVYGNVFWVGAHHMPRWASRITFELTAVGIQRLATEDHWVLSLRRLESSS